MVHQGKYQLTNYVTRTPQPERTSHIDQIRNSHVVRQEQHQSTNYVTTTPQPERVNHYDSRVSHTVNHTPVRASRQVNGSTTPNYRNEERIDRHKSTIIRPENHNMDRRVIDTNTKRGELKVVDERRLDDVHVKDNVYGETRVKDVRETHEVTTSEKFLEEHVINRYENRGEPRELRPSVMRNQVNFDVIATREVAEIRERFVEVPVEVLIEKPIANVIEKEVYYDVYVETPIEKVIEKEVIREIHVEKHYEKIIEIPYETYVEVPIEKHIEQEVYYEEIVEVPVEVYEEQIIETVVENPIYHDRTENIDSRDINRYHGQNILPTQYNESIEEVVVERPVYYDNIIEKIVNTPIEVIKERPFEVINQVHTHRQIERPVYRDNVIEKIVEIPVERVVERTFDRIVDQPVYIENIRENRYPVERIIERVVEQNVENYVERPVYIDNIIEKYIDNVIEVPVQHVIDVPVYVDKIIDNPIYKESIRKSFIENYKENRYPVEQIVEVPVENLVIETIERPYDVVHNVPREHINHIQVDRIVEQEVYVDNIIERQIEVEQITEVEVENEIVRPVYIENINYKTVYQTVTIEKPVEHIVEKIVEYPYEIIKEIPVDFIIEREYQVPKFIEQDVYIEKEVYKDVPIISEVDEEVDMRLQMEVEDLQIKIEILTDEYEHHLKAFKKVEEKWHDRDKLGSVDWYQKCTDLRYKIIEIEQKMKKTEQRITTRRNSRITTVTYVEDPTVINLRTKEMELRTANEKMLSKIQFHEERTRIGTTNYQYEIEYIKDDKGNIIGEKHNLIKNPNEHVDVRDNMSTLVDYKRKSKQLNIQNFAEDINVVSGSHV